MNMLECKKVLLIGQNLLTQKNTLSTWSLKYILSRTRPFCRIMHSNIFYIQLGPAVALVTLVPAVS